MKGMIHPKSAELKEYVTADGCWQAEDGRNDRKEVNSIKSGKKFYYRKF